MASQYKLSLRMTHPSADLFDFSRMLDSSDVFMWKRGDLRLSPRGRVIGPGERREFFCSITIDHNPGVELPELIVTTLRRLEPHKETLDELTTSGGSMDFFVGWFAEDDQSGETFDWTVLRGLADYRISLVFDVYGALDPEEEEAYAGTT